MWPSKLDKCRYKSLQCRCFSKFYQVNIKQYYKSIVLFSLKVFSFLRYSPGENDLVVAARSWAPLTTGNGPLVLAVAGALGRGPRADRIERRYEVRRAIGDIMDARHGWLVYVHRVWVLETRVPRAQQVDQHQVVLHEHRHGVRLLDVWPHQNN